MRKVLALLQLMTMLVIGCSGAQPIMAPSGNMGVEIWCDTAMSYCYQEAAKQCPRGYIILGEDSYSATGTLIIECKDSYQAPAPKQEADATTQNLVVRKQVVRKNFGAENLIYQWNIQTPRRIDNNTTLDRYTYEGVTDTIVVQYTLDRCPEDGYSKEQTDKQHDKMLRNVRSKVELRRAARKVFRTSKYLEYRYLNKAGHVVMSVTFDSTMVD